MAMLPTARPYPIHPIAEIFPMKTGESLDDLAASIKERGLLEEIVLYQGQVLDGKRRQAAAIRAGVKPLYREFGSHASDGFNPADWAFTVNFHRRHLSKAERALAAAKYANMKRGHNQHSTMNGTKPVSQREAAEKFGVNDQTVGRAAKVLKGVPELEKAVLTETVSVSDAAAIAGEDPKLQRQALQAVEEGKSGTLKEAVQKAKGPPPIDPAGLCRTIDDLIEQLEGADVRVRGRGKVRDAREALDLACESLKSARSFLRRLCGVLGAAA
jgi:ParB-like chromosome segregation protein Spo0J